MTRALLVRVNLETHFNQRGRVGLMETLESLRGLYKYNRWANQLALDSLKAYPSAKALRALSHLVIAEREWLLRMKASQNPDKQNFWQDLSLEECESLNEENQRQFAEWMTKLTEEGLDFHAEYKNSKGSEFRTPFRDVLTHVALHSTYHRGQIAAAIRAEGGTPAVTDFIIFQRQQGSK